MGVLFDYFAAPDDAAAAAVVERGPADVLDTVATKVAPDAELRRVAREWSRLPEFGGVADPSDLESVLRDLTALARTATDGAQRLYCRACA